MYCRNTNNFLLPLCFKQHINREPIEHPLFMSTEILETIPKVEKALSDFKAQIMKFYKLLKELLPKEHQKLRLQSLFIDDLKKQFVKIIIMEKKYFVL